MVMTKQVINSMVAHGAVFWTVKKKGWRRRRYPNLECYSGRCDTPDFASKVIAKKENTMCERTVGKDTVLLIGVPLVKNGNVYGVIEVIQRAESSDLTRRGYLRFVSVMAESASQSKALKT